MITPLDDFALLLVAYRERRNPDGHDGVAALAADLARRNVASEIGAGFIKGIPTIDEMLRALASPNVIVYPLFLTDGYFNRVRLPQLLAKAAVPRRLTVLDPLGCDPGFAALVARKAGAAAQAAGFAPERTGIVLLAHGSASDPGSRETAEHLTHRLADGARFRIIRIAFLEERPSLAEALAAINGPVVVVDLLAGSLRDGVDVPQLLGELGGGRVALAGNVGAFDGVADLVMDAVARASTGGAERV